MTLQPILLLAAAIVGAQAFSSGPPGCTEFNTPNHGVGKQEGDLGFAVGFEPALVDNKYTPGASYTVTLLNMATQFRGFRLWIGGGSGGSACMGHSNNDLKSTASVAWTAPSDGSTVIRVNAVGVVRKSTWTQITASFAAGEVNACETNPCTGDFEVCVDRSPGGSGPDGRDCACIQGYTREGDVCVDEDGCEGQTCMDSNSECQDVTAPGVGFTCECKTGFERDNVNDPCVDIDACATETCAANADCSDQPAPSLGFSCACQAGFESSDPTSIDCSDIDGCTENPCDPNSILDDCVDAVAPAAGTERTCGACSPGYEGDGDSCTEVDRCADETDNCDDNASCTDLDPPSVLFNCDCNTGFFGDGETCTECTACPAGQYASTPCETSDNDCTACPDNSDSSAGSIGIQSCQCNTNFFDSDSGDGVTCELIVCQEGEFLDGGSCTTCPSSECPAGMRQAGVCGGSTNTLACVSCPDKEFRSTPGTECSPCEDGTQPSDDHTQCDNCPAHTAGTGGECLPCRAGLEPAPNRESCDECKLNAIKPTDDLGPCTLCGDGTTANQARTSCEPCQPKFIGTQGFCHTECGDGEQPNEAQTACVTCEAGTAGVGECIECTGLEFAGAGAAACMNCPDGMTVNNDNTGCVSCATVGVDVVGTGGECNVVCANLQVPNSGLTACETCGDGTKPMSDNSACESCSVVATDQVGTGGQCPTACRDTNQIPNSGRTACESCDSEIDFYGPNEDFDACVCMGTRKFVNNECVSCERNEISVGDACQVCPEDEGPNEAQTACVPCTAQQVWDNGFCETCGDGTFADKTAQQCFGCTAPNVGTGGSCDTACGAGEQPNSGKTACEDCAANFISTDGLCGACPLGTTSNNLNTACVSCGEREIGLQAGGCTACSSGESPDGNHRVCEADSTVDFFWPTTDVSLLNGNAFETDLRSELQTETSLTDSDLSITTVVLAGDCVQTTVQGRKALVDSALGLAVTGKVNVQAGGSNLLAGVNCDSAQTLQSVGPAQPSTSTGDDDDNTVTVVVVFLVVFLVSFIAFEGLLMQRMSHQPTAPATHMVDLTGKNKFSV